MTSFSPRVLSVYKEIIRLYCVEKRTISSIARICDTSRVTVYSVLRHRGITLRRRTKRSSKSSLRTQSDHHNELTVILKFLYIDLDLSASNIGKLLHRTTRTIEKALQKRSIRKH